MSIFSEILGGGGEGLGKMFKDIVGTFKANPEDVLKFQELIESNRDKIAEREFQLETKAQDVVVQLAQVDAADRDSARKRQIALHDAIPGTLAIGVTLGFFGILGLFAFHSVPEASRDILNIMLGSLGTAWITIVAYYFGSSAGSAQKNTVIATALKGK